MYCDHNAAKVVNFAEVLPSHIREGILDDGLVR